MQLRGVLESGFRSLMPEVSRLATLGSSESSMRIANVNRRAIKLIFAVGLPAFALVFAVATPVLRLWLGARFRPEIVPALRVLLAGCFLSLLGVPGYYTLLGLGRIKLVIASQVVQAGTNGGIILVMGLLSGMASTGLTSAAAAAGMAAGGMYCLFIGIARPRLVENPDTLQRETYAQEVTD